MTDVQSETVPRTASALVHDAAVMLGERADELAACVESRRRHTIDPKSIGGGLLEALVDLLGDLEWMPDGTWWRDYFLLTGEHMILTDDGWQPACVKDWGEYGYDPEDIYDEVNAPGGGQEGDHAD